MAQVGSKEIAEQKIKNFMEAPAPMTAKCILRDELREACELNEQQACDLVASIVNRLAIFEFHIEQAQD